MENLPLHNLFTNEFHLNFLETPYQDALDAVKDQKNELKKNEARLLAKEQEQTAALSKTWNLSKSFKK